MGLAEECEQLARSLAMGPPGDADRLRIIELLRELARRERCDVCPHHLPAE